MIEDEVGGKTEGADSAAAAEPDEKAAPGGAGVEAAAEAADAAADDAGAAAPDLVPWNGEVEQLRALDWYKGLDAKAQDALLRGVEAKYRNYDRKYRSTWDEQAKKGKELDALHASLREQERKIMRMWTGQEDPMSAKQAEVEELKKAHEAMIQRVVEEHRRELEEAKKPSPELAEKVKELEAQKARIKELETGWEGSKGELAAIREAEGTAALGAFEDWIVKAAPHLVGDDADSEGFDALVNLIAGGATPERALQMVLGAYPAPKEKPKAEPEAPAAGVRAMGARNANGTEARETRDLQSVFDQMLRESRPAWGR